jgi:hypothetical protein
LVWRKPEIVIVATPALCGETWGIAEVQPVQKAASVTATKPEAFIPRFAFFARYMNGKY